MTKKIYILHGYNATPSDHWFPWLQERLIEDGHSVTVHKMPNAQSPKPEEWIATLLEETTQFNENTFFITHSLGSINLLNYLSQLDHIPTFGGFILVSEFNQSLPTLPSLDPFIEKEVHFKKINSSTSSRVVLAAEDDYVVPFSFSQQLSEQLDSEFHIRKHGGHFLKSDGFTTFPDVYTLLQEMMTR